MSRLLSALPTSVTVADAVTALAFPPVTSGDVSNWNSTSGVIPEFDLDIWAVSATNVTVAQLLGAMGHPLVYADNALTSVTNATDTLTKAAHGLLNGDGPIRITVAGGVLPAGLTAGTDYWVIYVSSSAYKLAATRADALAATPVVVPFSTDGSGTFTISDTADTQRIFWHSITLLGNVGDGAIALTAQQAYTMRCAHSPRVFAYAIGATLSSAVATTIRITPVVDR